MIDSRLAVEYLKPELWKNLGEVIAPLMNRGRILHVLKSSEGEYTAYDSKHKRFSMRPFIDNEGINADKIWKEHCDIIEIRCYTFYGLNHYYEKIQERDVYSQDIDDYLGSLYRIQENTDGITIYIRDSETPKKRNYMECMKALPAFEGDDVVVLVWLTKQNVLFFNCILKISSGKLLGISTYDRYGDCEENYETVYSLVQKEYQCNIIAVKMEFDEYVRKASQIFR